MQFASNVPDPNYLVTYKDGKFGTCLPGEHKDSAPLVFFPVFTYKDFLFSFSSKIFDSAPFIPIRAIDIYFNYIAEVLEFDSWLYSYYEYLEYMGIRSSSVLDPGFLLAPYSIARRILFTIFREFYLLLCTNHLVRSEKVSEATIKKFQKFRFSKDKGLPSHNIKRFYANDGKSILYCYCFVFELWPNTRKKRYGFDEFLLLAIENFPQYFCFKPRSFLHEEYLTGWLSNDDPWYYFYLNSECNYLLYIQEPVVGYCTVRTPERTTDNSL